MTSIYVSVEFAMICNAEGDCVKVPNVPTAITESEVFLWKFFRACTHSEGMPPFVAAEVGGDALVAATHFMGQSRLLVRNGGCPATYYAGYDSAEAIPEWVYDLLDGLELNTIRVVATEPTPARVFTFSSFDVLKV